MHAPLWGVCRCPGPVCVPGGGVPCGPGKTNWCGRVGVSGLRVRETFGFYARDLYCELLGPR